MKKRYTEEQIIKALKEYEAGVKVDELCRRLAWIEMSLMPTVNLRDNLGHESIVTTDKYDHSFDDERFENVRGFSVELSDGA